MMEEDALKLPSSLTLKPFCLFFACGSTGLT
jgi:hypothetical protein